MSAGINSTHAPALDLPARFFACGMVFFALLAASAPWTLPLLLGGFASPLLLAFVHANTVGVIGAIVIGASYQLVPVVIETPLASPPLGRHSFWAYLAGLLCFVTGLALDWIPGLALGGTLLGIAFGLYIGVIVATLRRAPHLDVAAWHIAAALANLAAAVGLGVALAFNKATGFLGGYTLALLGAHATLMLGGWVAVLLAGVAYRLVGMFTLAEDALWHPGAWAGLVLSAGAPWFLAAYWLGFAPRPVGLLGAVALLAGGLLFAGQLAHLYRRRRRRGFDIHIPFTLTAAGCGVVCGTLLAVGLLGGNGPNAALWVVVGWLAIAGLAETAIQGFFYKIATFLIWLQRYAPLAGRQRVPRLDELYAPRLAFAGWLLWTVGLLLAVAAIAAQSMPLSQLAGVAQMVGLGCFLANVAAISAHWRRAPVADARPTASVRAGPPAPERRPPAAISPRTATVPGQGGDYDAIGDQPPT